MTKTAATIDNDNNTIKIKDGQPREKKWSKSN